MERDGMRTPEVDIVAAGEIRHALVEAGDFRGEIAFQNDVNRLLAAIDGAGSETLTPWEALAAPAIAKPMASRLVGLLRRRAA